MVSEELVDLAESAVANLYGSPRLLPVTPPRLGGNLTSDCVNCISWEILLSIETSIPKARWNLASQLAAAVK